MKDKTLKVACGHEAAHAVMQYLVGFQCGKLTASADGSGFCEGTGKLVDSQSLLFVILAGLAYETFAMGGRYGCIFVEILQTTDPHPHPSGVPDDAMQARKILADREDLRVSFSEGRISIISVEESLKLHLCMVADILFPFRRVIAALGRKLEPVYELSARSVAAFISRRVRTMSPPKNENYYNLPGSPSCPHFREWVRRPLKLKRRPSAVTSRRQRSAGAKPLRA